jgi:hypothetical protein
MNDEPGEVPTSASRIKFGHIGMALALVPIAAIALGAALELP